MIPINIPSTPAFSAARTAIFPFIVSGWSSNPACGFSGENPSGTPSGPPATPASGSATRTWICGARHCGQNGRPSSIVVPHCWQGCSTALKLAHYEAESKTSGHWGIAPATQDCNHSVSQCLLNRVVRSRVHTHINQGKARTRMAGLHRYDVLVSVGSHLQLHRV